MPDAIFWYINKYTSCWWNVDMNTCILLNGYMVYYFNICYKKNGCYTSVKLKE